jgi:hypothetical protein
MFVPQARLALCLDDHVASAGITKSLLASNSRCPARFCPCGVLRFVLDGMAAKVSFELPPARFASFLVREPKVFPFVVRRRLLSVMGLLGVLAGDEGESEFMVVWGREKKEIGLQKRGLERRTKDGLHDRKAGERLKKTS